MINRWHAEDREVILHQLGTDPARGLAPAESSRRLLEHGPNLLREQPAASGGLLLARRLTDAPVLVLLAAAVLCARIGAWPSGLFVGAVAVAGGVLGFLQQWRGGPARAPLARLWPTSARVVRGGKSFLVPAAELVPGDLAEVREGDLIAADMRLQAARRLFTDESALTGMALPVGKDPSLVLPADAVLADRANLLFAGTRVQSGEGTAIVVATGMRTEVGRIAGLLESVEAGEPLLQKQLAGFARSLTLGGLLVGAAVLAVCRFRGMPDLSLLAAAASLAVAAVPAGLPAIVFGALALGVRRLARRGVEVRALPAVESLGGVTIIGCDTTGTLTRNELTVRELFLEGDALEVGGSGHAPEGRITRGGAGVDPEEWETLGTALRIGALCSTATLVQEVGGAWRVVGDPTEGALLALAAKAGIWRDDLAREHPLLQEFPYTAERRRMTVVVPGRGGRRTALMRGEPDVVLAHCMHHRTSAGVRPLSPADRERILHRVEEMAGRALRVLGLAYREDAVGRESHALERAMVWTGLVGMLDPPRPEVHAAVAECRDAGISPVILTGDHAQTGLAVAREIGALRPGDEAIGGDELDRLTPEALAACIERYRVYARVTAEHKLRIVRAWKRGGRLIAMTGDGVNDAPALKAADVGIAMGRSGSAVASDSAALVIADDSFASIVGAVAEGRRMYRNLVLAASCLLAFSVAGVLALSACLLAGLPPPLTTAQILWAYLIFGGLPALAVVLGPGAGSMREPPRDPRARVPGGDAAALAVVGGALVAVATVAAFLISGRAGQGDAARAATSAFAVFSLGLAVHALAAGNGRRPLASLPLLPNRWLPAAVALATLLVVGVVQLPLPGFVFDTVPLRRGDWLLVAGLALAPLPLMEVFKAWLRSRDGR